MINFTRYLANYFGKRGVRANCLCPGGYNNEQPGPFLDHYTKRCPNRPGCSTTRTSRGGGLPGLRCFGVHHWRHPDGGRGWTSL